MKPAKGRSNHRSYAEVLDNRRSRGSNAEAGRSSFVGAIEKIIHFTSEQEDLKNIPKNLHWNVERLISNYRN